MGGRTAKCAAVLVLACVATSTFASSASSVTASSEGDFATAHGTLHSEDGRCNGDWRASIRASETGDLDGSMVVEGLGAADPMPISGLRDDRSVAIYAFPAEVNARTAEQDHSPQFRGTVSGVLIEGTFSGLSNCSGTWQGWWTDVPSDDTAEGEASSSDGADSQEVR